MNCPSCGKVNWKGVALCEFCGHMMMSLSQDVRNLTGHYSINPSMMNYADYPDPRRDTLQKDESLTFTLLQTGHRVTIVPQRHITFGRADPTVGWLPMIDCTLYRGKELGVSRIHADLYVEDTHVFLLELGSTNGTLANGRSVEVGKPRQIRDGDEIALSKLLIKVHFD